jgi:hypothetical protein
VLPIVINNFMLVGHGPIGYQNMAYAIKIGSAPLGKIILNTKREKKK